MSEEPGGWSDGVVPLSWWERIIVTAVGGALLAAGGLAVFRSANQAGSVTLLLVGGVFVLFGINGMPLISAKIKDLELQLPARLRRAVRDLADHLPDDEARLVLSTIKQVNPEKYAEPLISLVDALLFEARVRDAAMLTGERVVPRTSPGIGEPLLDVVLTGDVRIGLFATFSPTTNGRLAPEARDEFLARVPAAGVRGVLLITCVPDGGDLAALAERIPVPTVIVRTGPHGEVPPLGPFLDSFRAPVPRQR